MELENASLWPSSYLTMLLFKTVYVKSDFRKKKIKPLLPLVRLLILNLLVHVSVYGGGGGDFCLNWTDFTIYGIAQAIWAVIIAWKILSDNIALIKHGEHETMVSFLYTLVLLSLVQLSKLYK